MLSFKEFLNEANEHNGHMTARYELGAALHLHDMVRAANKDTSKESSHVQKMRKDHEVAGSHLDKSESGQKVRDSADKRAKASAEGFADSLKKNHKVELKDIASVHHTGAAGLSAVTGNKAHDNKTSNPHDIAVKTKNSHVIGSSLKATSGTMSNNGSKAHPAMSDSYKTAAEKLKSAKSTEEMTKIGKSAHKEAGKAYTNHFNTAHPDHQRKEMQSLIRQNTDKDAVPLDYTKGNGKSTPYHKMKIVQHVNTAHHFSAKHVQGSDGTTYTHISAHSSASDKEGTHIGQLEHRSTHSMKLGKAMNAQHNFKAAPGMTHE
jgi:hypothetical protein